ncbi:hypothetical protein DKX38_017697 [Salix brachista]|uniref:Uncharacterized protein n=1 Tax=Salix brachista TaxID=2182728 RepID=A0A5N5KWV5_9ROSI|nr:hypothetical protein DKX38_017697 [Salix brachista]
MRRCLSVHVDTLRIFLPHSITICQIFHLCFHVCYLINAMNHQYPIQFDLQLNELLEEKVRPYIQNINSGALPSPIIIQPQNQDKKVPPFFPLLLGLYFSIPDQSLFYPYPRYSVATIRYSMSVFVLSSHPLIAELIRREATITIMVEGVATQEAAGAGARSASLESGDGAGPELDSGGGFAGVGVDGDMILLVLGRRSTG